MARTILHGYSDSLSKNLRKGVGFPGAASGYYQHQSWEEFLLFDMCKQKALKYARKEEGRG